ncbi:MAG: alpha-amylase family glycosyl hydrolase [Thiolinea sp.]
MTALWVGPIFKNKLRYRKTVTCMACPSGYHGYWITDFMQVDPHLGTVGDFANLVNAAHKRHQVFMDIITSHTADMIKFSDADYAYKTKEEAPYLDVLGNAFDDEFAYSGQADYSFPEMNVYGFPHLPMVPDARSDGKKSCLAE